MAVLVLDLPVLAVNVKLGGLVLADLAPGIDGIFLSKWPLLRAVL